MTLQEAKDKVAQSRAYRNWAEMETMQHQKSASSWQDLLKATEEAAELYANSIHESYQQKGNLYTEWQCPNCGNLTKESNYLCCCSQSCLKSWLEQKNIIKD